MKTLGQRIRELRQGQGFSLRELGKRLGKSAAFLSDIELGRRFPSLEVLHQIEEDLGVDVNELHGFDTRAPIAILKRMAEVDPQYGIALRRIVETEVSAEELLKLADRKGESNARRANAGGL